MMLFDPNKNSHRNVLIIIILLIALGMFSFVNRDKAFSKVTCSNKSVIVGADRLFSEFSHFINGKKVALVTNHTGRLSNGTHLADTLFKYEDAELTVLFGMHFNIRTTAGALKFKTDYQINYTVVL